MKRTEYRNAPDFVERRVGIGADPDFATPSLPIRFEDRLYLPAAEYWLTQHLTYGTDDRVTKHTGVILMRVGDCGICFEMTPAMLREQAAGFITVAAANAAIGRAKGNGQ